MAMKVQPECDRCRFTPDNPTQADRIYRCGQVVEMARINLGKLRVIMAKSYGWTTVKRHGITYDYCPECSATISIGPEDKLKQRGG